MKTERVLLSILAVVVGLLAAGIAFYLYENTKNIEQPETTAPIVAVTPTPVDLLYLVVNEPADESVTDNKIITISGNTQPDSIIVILSELDEQVLIPTQNGDFTTTTTIDDGYNIIDIMSIAPNGESEKITKTVTFSTEEF